MAFCSCWFRFLVSNSSLGPGFVYMYIYDISNGSWFDLACCLVKNVVIFLPEYYRYARVRPTCLEYRLLNVGCKGTISTCRQASVGRR